MREAGPAWEGTRERRRIDANRTVTDIGRRRVGVGAAVGVAAEGAGLSPMTEPEASVEDDVEVLGNGVSVLDCPDGTPIAVLASGDVVLATGQADHGHWIEIRWPLDETGNAWVRAGTLAAEGSLDDLPKRECDETIAVPTRPSATPRSRRRRRAPRPVRPPSRPGPRRPTQPAGSPRGGTRREDRAGKDRAGEDRAENDGAGEDGAGDRPCPRRPCTNDDRADYDGAGSTARTGRPGVESAGDHHDRRLRRPVPAVRDPREHRDHRVRHPTTRAHRM